MGFHIVFYQFQMPVKKYVSQNDIGKSRRRKKIKSFNSLSGLKLSIKAIPALQAEFELLSTVFYLDLQVTTKLAKKKALT